MSSSNSQINEFETFQIEPEIATTNDKFPPCSQEKLCLRGRLESNNFYSHYFITYNYLHLILISFWIGQGITHREILPVNMT